MVDFTANNINKLDERIGLMENLVSFRIANNPLRERKYLTLDTEDLKRDLRERCAPENPTEEEEGSVQTEFTLAPENPPPSGPWSLKSGGILDRSFTDLRYLDPEDLEPLLSSSSDIRCLYLHHNRLQAMPIPALSLLAHSLTDLDLSSNPLDPTELIAAPLTLPQLQNLNLSATGLSNLERLQANLSAPSLTFLDVSNNRLTGPLPIIRQTYPNLITFLVSDNQIQSLEFDSVCGLQVLDVSNNNIDYLPPKLGLLGTEGRRTGGSVLRRLEVGGNSFRVPRWQIVAKGTESVLEWLKNKVPADKLREWENEED
jgi:Leucine Rich Repeat